MPGHCILYVHLLMIPYRQILAKTPSPDDSIIKFMLKDFVQWLSNFHTPIIIKPPIKGDTLCKKTRMTDRAIQWLMFSHFDTISEFYRQTDRNGNAISVWHVAFINHSTLTKDTENGLAVWLTAYR